MLSPILQHVVINNNAGYAYIPRHPANRKHHPLYRHRSKDRLKRFTLSAITSSSRDPSSEPGCSRDQEQPRPDDDGSDGSRDALTGRCETFDGDGCRHDSHRAQVHDPDDEEDHR